MPVDKATQAQVFGAPIPGESLTSPPRNMPFEKPPQFVKIEDAMNFLMNQFLEPSYFKELMGLLDAGMSVEAVVRTILFGGFTMGKWTPDLAMLMYKPLMLAVVTLAKKAGLNHTPLVMQESLDKFLDGKNKQYRMYDRAKNNNKLKQLAPEIFQDENPVVAAAGNSNGGGFMQQRKQ